MVRKQRSRQPIAAGKQPVFRRNARKPFKSPFRGLVVALVAGERMQPHQRYRRHRIRPWSWRILKWLATHVQSAHGRSVGSAVEESAAFAIAESRKREVHGLLRRRRVA